MLEPKFIRDLNNVNSSEAIQKLWLVGNRYIVTSYICNRMAHETMAFESDENGVITDYSELGCIRDKQDHETLVNDLC